MYFTFLLYTLYMILSCVRLLNILLCCFSFYMFVLISARSWDICDTQYFLSPTISIKNHCYISNFLLTLFCSDLILCLGYVFTIYIYIYTLYFPSNKIFIYCEKKKIYKWPIHPKNLYESWPFHNQLMVSL